MIESSFSNSKGFFRQIGEKVWLSEHPLLEISLNWFFFAHTNAVTINMHHFQKSDVMFNEDLVYYEDLTKWVELGKRTPFSLVLKPLSMYRETPESLMSDTHKFNKATLDFYIFLKNNSLNRIDSDLTKIVNQRLKVARENILIDSATKISFKYWLEVCFKYLSSNMSIAGLKIALKSYAKRIIR